MVTEEITVIEGFKLTEMGLIPNDWEVKLFGDVLTGFSSGATPYRGRSDYYKGAIKWITSGELNYNIIIDTIEKITEEAVKNTNLKLLPKGTFLMAITGLEAAGTRGSCGIVGAEATTNQSCMALFSTEKLTTEYLYHYYIRNGDWLALKYCQGTKQQSYTGKIVRVLPIVLPPTLAEQRAISTALSDVDTLITNLDVLITKKRNIKLGAMQQLLTGKKRLPGFSGEWETKSLGEVADITKLAGFEYSNYFNSYKDGGEIIVVRGTNITKNKMDLSDVKTIPKGTSDVLPRSKLQKGDLVFAYVGTIGPVYLIEESDKYHLGPNTAKITAKNGLKTEFAFCYFTSELIKSEISEHVSIGAQSSLSMSKIRKFKVFLPSLDEQSAIAQILSDMAAELDTLTQKLDKYKALKQGMMQQLLTGKIRLI